MKVLIVSHNPISHRGNMGKTLMSLFSECPSNMLCQLFVYPSVPEAPFCGAYYRVTDKEMLRSWVDPRPVGGPVLPERLGSVEGIFEDPRDVQLYRDPRNKSPLRQLLRDVLWTNGRWDSSALEEWLDQEDPNVLFVVPGGAKFLYEMAMTIARCRRIPTVCYLCDEYYFVERPRGPLGKLRLTLLRRKMASLLECAEHLTVISPEMEARYGPYFHIPVSVLMTGAGIALGTGTETGAAPQRICYFGNIRCWRYRSLERVADALEELNRRLGRDWKLWIHTQERDPEILSRLKAHPAVIFGPFVTGGDYEQALREAGLLLHVEDFSPEAVDRVRHSVSTKIGDSLASGTPLVAYSPAGVASTEHLRRNGCALLADTPEKLEKILLTAFTDSAARRDTVARALATAARFHSSAATSAHLREVLESAVAQWESGERRAKL